MSTPFPVFIPVWSVDATKQYIFLNNSLTTWPLWRRRHRKISWCVSSVMKHPLYFQMLSKGCRHKMPPGTKKKRFPVRTCAYYGLFFYNVRLFSRFISVKARTIWKNCSIKGKMCIKISQGRSGTFATLPIYRQSSPNRPHARNREATYARVSPVAGRSVKRDSDCHSLMRFKLICINSFS